MPSKTTSTTASGYREELFQPLRKTGIGMQRSRMYVDAKL
jgi:hypothetical protein